MPNQKTNIQKHAKDALDLTEEIISECPNRITGSNNSKKAAQLIGNELDKHCDSVVYETFKTTPDSFLAFTKVWAITYIIALTSFFIGNSFIIFGSIVFLFGLAITFSQFVFYKNTFDFLFKKSEGVNVIGTIEPEDIVKQQVIISSHHDAPYEFSFYRQKVQKWYVPRVIASTATYFSAIIFTFYLTILWFIGTSAPLPAENIKIIFAFLSPFVIQYYFFIDKKRISPGAGDNMIACTIGIKLSEIFNSKRKDKNGLKNTRLIFLSTDAEEVGLRGARDYCEKHKEELCKIPTYVYNIDSLYDSEHLQFLTSDLNGFQKLSSNLANECKTISEDFGYRSELFQFIFGAGGTDAAEFAAIGIEATTLIAMPTNLMRTELYYHTIYDTIDKIEPKAVEACIDIAEELITRKEKAITD